MTIAELAVAEAKALASGDIATAQKLQAARWAKAMGMCINSENTKRQPRD
jgi:hypothetical protein